MEKEYLKNKSSGLTILKIWGTIFLIGLFFLLVPAKAQNTDNTVRYCKLPLQVSVGNQTVGFPYQNLSSAFNFSFSVGTEIGYNKSKRHRICQTVNLGFFINEVIGNTVSLSTDFCYRYTHKSGVFADSSLGIGILNQYHPRDIFKYNSTSGEYDRVKDYGKISSLIGYGLSLGYDFSKNTKHAVSFFVRNSFFIQSPYFDLKMFPIMPQSIIEVGLRIKIRKNEK